MVVTQDPHQVTPATLDELRAVGCSDVDILDAVQVIGFFNYYTRLADALGIEPEPEWAHRHHP